LGLQPHLLSDTLIDSLFAVAARHISRADPSLMRPTINWRTPTNPC
jgi:UDP-sulfoquinovose synthase